MPAMCFQALPGGVVLAAAVHHTLLGHKPERAVERGRIASVR